MGFWGIFVVARADVPLSELSSIEALGGESDWEYTGLDGWRIAQVHRADSPSEDQLMAAVREVAGPLMVATVADSDFALVECVAPGGGYFSFALHPRSAVAYEVPVDEADQAAAVNRLSAWAGGGADPVELRRAVEGKLVFAEDSVKRLAGALGVLPMSEISNYLFGDDYPGAAQPA